MPNLPPLTVKIWGEWACFTRPEMKVERVSYPVMTPSAARGILEAILWKPEFCWRIREIRVLRPIRYFSLMRNEVNNIASHRSAQSWRQDNGGYFADDDRTQRHTLALREAAYVICADIHLKPHAEADPAKYRDQFRRRVARGQCHHTPYLGCREFPACFGDPEAEDQPLPLDLDLGLMLFDLTYEHDATKRAIRGRPIFFPAKLEGGVLRVPPELYGPGG